ncbi:MAG: hypothetical protein OXU78_04515 [Deltaproteobacteria bacterium]|nr:hypothetical protein [Deltaproteobacteria bacterium]
MSASFLSRRATAKVALDTGASPRHGGKSCHPFVLYFASRKSTARKIDMNISAIIFAFTAALFAASAFADHNRTDEQGRKQGHWTEFPEQEDLLSMEGNYVDGREDGNWVWQWASGKVSEGPMKNGKRHGYWVLRFADGQVQKGPYVNGKQHGEWVTQFADGDVHEGPMVAGKRHGKWVGRSPAGDVREIPYVNGKRHGKEIWRFPNGFVWEIPYKHGKEHGKSIMRDAAGNVRETSYKEGEIHGKEIVRFDDGDVHETSYKDGVRQEEIRWYANGGAVKTIYNREAMPDTDDEKYSGDDGFDKWFADQKAWEKRNVLVIAVGPEPVIADFDDVDEWREVHEEWAERKDTWEKQQNTASASGDAGN